jgi:hypothetical protein
MKFAFSMIFVLCTWPNLASAQIGIYQHGAVVRMHMADCGLTRHGFITTFGGPMPQVAEEDCPEYTLVSDRVVFVILGRSSNQLIPLAETIDFRFQKTELAVRVDDARRECKFTIKEMMTRSEWDRLQRHIDERMKLSEESSAMKNHD